MSGDLFGGLATEPWVIHKSYYGTGEVYLFTFTPKFQIFRWSKKNNYFMYCNGSCIAFGGGYFNFYNFYLFFLFSDNYGLYIDSQFEYGSSKPCQTFQSVLDQKQLQSLSSTTDFKIYAIEVWKIEE